MVLTVRRCPWPTASGDSAPPPSTDQLTVLPTEAPARASLDLQRF